MGILKSRITRALLDIAGIYIWLYLVFRYPAVSLFTLLAPPVVAINFSKNSRVRNTAISIFVAPWLFIPKILEKTLEWQEMPVLQ